MTRTLLPGAIAGVWLMAGSAQAVVVTPNVSNTTASAVTSGLVPDPLTFLGFGSDLDLDVQQADAAAGPLTVTSIPNGGAETSIGEALTHIDLADINNSLFKARSEVFTAAPPAVPTAIPGFPINMSNQSSAAIVATLDTVDLVGPGETAMVDLVFNVSGSLVYQDPTGVAAATEVMDPFDLANIDIVPDMEASVSVLLLLADVVDDPALVDPNNPPVSVLFNGSATLESVLGGGTPVLNTVGDLQPSDFTMSAACDAFLCQYDIDTSFVFNDVQSIGFGETFEIGFLLLTSVEGLSDNADVAGRRLLSAFDDTASFEVTLDVQPASAAPEPATAVMLALGLAAFGATRRRPRRTVQ